MMIVYQVFVGIDIAARSFTASWTRDRRSFSPAQTFSQDPDGFARLERQLTATGVAPAETLLVLEATSSYWVALAVHLHAAGYHVAVVNPMHLRNYARSLPRRAKTDALDAQLLAQFAAERQPDAWTPPEQVYHELRQRLVTREALVTMRQQTRNQHHAISQWPVTIASALQHLEEVIADLDERIKRLDGELEQLLADSAWATSATLLLSIPGIGVQSTAWLLVATLNFTLCASAEALAAYAGLVPLDYQSGSSVQRPARIGPGGNARLRRVIYLAAVVACRFNPPLKAYYERLRAAGKPVKVARCAVARKLLHQAWAVVTKQQPFDPDYPQPARAQAA
jgi:transposase